MGSLMNTLPTTLIYTLPTTLIYTLPTSHDYTLPTTHNYTLPTTHNYTLPITHNYTLPTAHNYTLPTAQATPSQQVLNPRATREHLFAHTMTQSRNMPMMWYWRAPILPSKLPQSMCKISCTSFLHSGPMQ